MGVLECERVPPCRMLDQDQCLPSTSPAPAGYFITSIQAPFWQFWFLFTLKSDIVGGLWKYPFFVTKSLPCMTFFPSHPDYNIIVVCNIYHPFVSLECVAMSSPSSVCLKCVRMCFSVFVCLECFRRHSAGVARLWWESSRQRWLESWCGGGGRLTIQRQV